mmetsp:Transcript_32468/g.74622  ORF Transcript_32468/g.74622 Transcript_32468/m.74622 type:complete len:92 (-) Transcript_32468:1367-1642(-)
MRPGSIVEASEWKSEKRLLDSIVFNRLDGYTAASPQHPHERERATPKNQSPSATAAMKRTPNPAGSSIRPADPSIPPIRLWPRSVPTGAVH